MWSRKRQIEFSLKLQGIERGLRINRPRHFAYYWSSNARQEEFKFRKGEASDLNECFTETQKGFKSKIQKHINIKHGLTPGPDKTEPQTCHKRKAWRASCAARRPLNAVFNQYPLWRSSTSFESETWVWFPNQALGPPLFPFQYNRVVESAAVWRLWWGQEREIGQKQRGELGKQSDAYGILASRLSANHMKL